MARVIREQKPMIFQLEENGEEYMLGVEVGAAMELFKGALYKKYPSLWRRILSVEEREKLHSFGRHGSHSLCNMGTMIVRASEATLVLNGVGDEYKRKDTAVAEQNKRNKEALNAAFNRRTPSKDYYSDQEAKTPGKDSFYQSDEAEASPVRPKRKLSFTYGGRKAQNTLENDTKYKDGFEHSFEKMDVPLTLFDNPYLEAAKDWITGTPVDCFKERKVEERTELRMRLLPSMW